MKTCTICGEEKSLDNFSIQRTGKMGKHAHCKECTGLGLLGDSSKNLQRALDYLEE